MKVADIDEHDMFSIGFARLFKATIRDNEPLVLVIEFDDNYTDKMVSSLQNLIRQNTAFTNDVEYIIFTSEKMYDKLSVQTFLKHGIAPITSTGSTMSTIRRFREDKEIKKNNYTLEDFFNEGVAKEKGITEYDIDTKELEMGIKVEKEHTKNYDVAKKIALDHLAEFSNYYTELLKLEDKLKKQNSKDKPND